MIVVVQSYSFLIVIIVDVIVSPQEHPAEVISVASLKTSHSVLVNHVGSRPVFCWCACLLAPGASKTTYYHFFYDLAKHSNCHELSRFRSRCFAAIFVSGALMLTKEHSAFRGNRK